VKPFSKKVFGRALPKNGEAGAEIPQGVVSNMPLI
jgi:hypothetical protein